MAPATAPYCSPFMHQDGGFAKKDPRKVARFFLGPPTGLMEQIGDEMHPVFLQQNTVV
jgi:hypothetical protein